MDYIINPSWFYWIEVSDCIKGCAMGAAVILLCAAIVLAILAKTDDDFDEDGANVKRKASIYCLVALAVCVAVIIFVPSKKTLIEMMIARKATYGNISWTVDQIKEVVDYIITAFKDVN